MTSPTHVQTELQYLRYGSIKKSVTLNGSPVVVSESSIKYVPKGEEVFDPDDSKVIYSKHEV